MVGRSDESRSEVELEEFEMSTTQEEPNVQLTSNPEWLTEFEAAARRPLKQHFKCAFIKTYKPVLDDEKYRSLETMEEYRQ